MEPTYCAVWIWLDVDIYQIEKGIQAVWMHAEVTMIKQGKYSFVNLPDNRG
jgi:hypothetical protein